MIYITNRRNQNDFLIHHGIKGQKWGVRRFQNEDGSLTPAGRERYGYGDVNRQESAIDAIENGAKNYSDPVDKIMAVTKDCLPISDGGQYAKRTGNKDRVLKAADLGLNALVNTPGIHDSEAIKEAMEDDYKGARDWFLWEDQTIGLPMIADLINQGYTPTQVKKMIDIVEQNTKAWESKYNYDTPADAEHELGDLVVFEIYNGNWRDMLKEFADRCEQVKKGG